MQNYIDEHLLYFIDTVYLYTEYYHLQFANIVITLNLFL